MDAAFSIWNILLENPRENIFIYSDRKNFSYRETLREVTNNLFFLIKNNITCKRAAVISENNPDVLFLLMALWQHKIVPVIVNTRFTRTEIDEIISLSGTEMVFCHKDLKFSSGLNIPSLKFPLKAKTDAGIDRGIFYDDTAVILFTSGSTGKPKGVELTFRTLSDAADLQAKFLCGERGDKWLASLPFCHIGGFSIFTRSVFTGASLVIPSSLDLKSLCSSIKKYSPEYMSLVGTRLAEMLEMDFHPGSQVKNILIGGGFTDPGIIIKALEKNWNISRVYGSTETAAFIAAINKNDLKNFPEATGKEIIPGSIFILDENKKTVTGSEGEIALKNIPLAKGYLNDPGFVSKIREGYFFTEDIGYINSEGFLFVLMRRKDMVVSGGENININEIENALRKVNGINDVFVIAQADAKWGQSISAIISGNKYLTEDYIKSVLKETLAGFKIPKKFYFIDEIPRNELGKVLLSSLKRILNIP